MSKPIPPGTPGLTISSFGLSIQIYSYLDFRFSFKCKIKTDRPIYIGKVAGHAHMLGRHVGIFVKQSDDKSNGWIRVFEKPSPAYTEIQDVDSLIRMDGPSFELATRCIYNSTSVDHVVVFGVKNTDEMCMAIIYYFIEGDDIILNDCILGRVDADELNRQLPDPIIDKNDIENNNNEQIQITISESSADTSFILFFLAFSILLIATCLLFKRRMTKFLIFHKIKKHQSLFSSQHRLVE